MVAPVAAAPASADSGSGLYGKVVAPAAFGVPQADSASFGFPSSPPIGPSYLGDGDPVYDTSLTVIVANAGSYPLSLPVITEVWTPGTVTVIENVTQPNGTRALEPVSIPARLDPRWSNATVTALPGSEGKVTVDLPTVQSEHPLEVRVGEATWELTYLTPATAIVTQTYTNGGIWVFALWETLTAFVAIGVALAVGKGIARKVRSVPRVHPLWPTLWVAVPVAFVLTAYVPVNQFLGGLSPLVIPIPVAVAVVPWFSRLFSGRPWSRLEGVSPGNLEDARKAESIVPFIETPDGLGVAPLTWRQVIFALAGVPPIAVQTEEVSVLGQKVRVNPKGMKVGPLLEGRVFESDADITYWVDTRSRPSLEPPRFRWTVEKESERAVTTPDGQTRTEKTKRRRFSPHVERGYLRGRFTPTRPMLEVLSQVRSAESIAYGARADQLALAEMRGELWSKVREEGMQAVEVQERKYQQRSRPRSAEEVRQSVENHRGRRPPPETPANGETS